MTKIYARHQVFPFYLFFIRNLCDQFCQRLHGSLIDVGKVLNFWFTQNGHKPFQLIDVVLSVKYDGLSQNFSKNTPDRPYVNWFRINCWANQNLRCSIRSWCHIISDVTSESFLSCQIHICKFQFTLFVHENILRLHVSMQNVCRMHEIDWN